MNDLVSIILPVYNGEKYLRESIDSVLAQTYQNWELLILDDCSSDSSSEIALEYSGRDSRVHYYRNKENLRLPANLNKGFSLAAGDYLTWTSDDNRYRPTAIERMKKALDQNNAHFVFASCRVIGEAGEEIEYINVGEASKRQLVGHNTVGACFMYTRDVYEAIGDYDPHFALVEDYDYWQRIYTKFGAVTISDILYEYRWHAGALTSTMKKEKFYQNLEQILLKNRPLFGKLGLPEKYYFYQGLSDCRKKRDKNPYRIKNKFYSTLFFIRYRIPRKIKKAVCRQNEK